MNDIRLEMPMVPRFKVAGSMIRTNKPIVSAAHAMQPPDLGVVVNAAGVPITLPAIQDAMQGEVYTVKNISTGDITVSTSGDDKITTSAGPISSVTLGPDESFDFDIETSTNTWVLR